MELALGRCSLLSRPPVLVLLWPEMKEHPTSLRRSPATAALNVGDPGGHQTPHDCEQPQRHLVTAGSPSPSQPSVSRCIADAVGFSRVQAVEWLCPAAPCLAVLAGPAGRQPWQHSTMLAHPLMCPGRSHLWLSDPWCGWDLQLPLPLPILAHSPASPGQAACGGGLPASSLQSGL